MSKELQEGLGMAAVILALLLGAGGCFFLINYSDNHSCKCNQVEAK